MSSRAASLQYMRYTHAISLQTFLPRPRLQTQSIRQPPDWRNLFLATSKSLHRLRPNQRRRHVARTPGSIRVLCMRTLPLTSTSQQASMTDVKVRYLSPVAFYPSLPCYPLRPYLSSLCEVSHSITRPRLHRKWASNRKSLANLT